jgi:shikimate kinase
LAALLGASALDLDRAFEAAHGDIDHFIQARGYAAYAAANVETYFASRAPKAAVVALSSGFMLYATDVHPAIHELQRQIAAAPTTVLLLPSLDLETCVAETMRRQARRPLAIRRPPAREEAVIRERFALYQRIAPQVVTTMQPADAIAREIIFRLADPQVRRPFTLRQSANALKFPS